MPAVSAKKKQNTPGTSAKHKTVKKPVFDIDADGSDDEYMTGSEGSAIDLDFGSSDDGSVMTFDEDEVEEIPAKKPKTPKVGTPVSKSAKAGALETPKSGKKTPKIDNSSIKSKTPKGTPVLVATPKSAKAPKALSAETSKGKKEGLKTPKAETPAKKAKTPKVATPAVELKATPIVKTKTPKVATPVVGRETPKTETPKIRTKTPKGDIPDVEIKTPKVATPVIKTKTPKVATPAAGRETPKILTPNTKIKTPKAVNSELKTKTPKESTPLIKTKTPKVETLVGKHKDSETPKSVKGTPKVETSLKNKKIAELNVKTPKSAKKNSDGVLVNKNESKDEKDRRTLFIKHVARRATEENIKELSSDIINVRTKCVNRQGKKKHQPKIIGAFLEFKNQRIAEKHFEDFKGKKLLGIPIIVDFVGEKASHKPQQTDTIDDLKRLFIAGHDDVEPASIKCIQKLVEEGAQITVPFKKRFFFLRFNDEEKAKAAVKFLSGQKVKGKSLIVQFAHKKPEKPKKRKPDLEKTEEGPSAKKSKKDKEVSKDSKKSKKIKVVEEVESDSDEDEEMEDGSSFDDMGDSEDGSDVDSDDDDEDIVIGDESDLSESDVSE